MSKLLKIEGIVIFHDTDYYTEYERVVLEGFEEKVKEFPTKEERKKYHRLFKEVKDMLEKMNAVDEIKTASLLVL